MNASSGVRFAFPVAVPVTRWKSQSPATVHTCVGALVHRVFPASVQVPVVPTSAPRPLMMNEPEMAVCFTRITANDGLSSDGPRLQPVPLIVTMSAPLVGSVPATHEVMHASLPTSHWLATVGRNVTVPGSPVPAGQSDVVHASNRFALVTFTEKGFPGACEDLLVFCKSRNTL